MKVNGQIKNSLANNVESAKSTKAENKKTAGGAQGLGDLVGNQNSAKVNVSDRAQMMQKAKDIASSTSVDEAKVARLQKMIDEGKYKVDADAIADRLVDEHLRMPE